MKLLPNRPTLRLRETASRYLWDLLQMGVLSKRKEMKSMIAKFKFQIHPLRHSSLTRTKSNCPKFLRSKKMKQSHRKDLSQLKPLFQNKKMKRSNLSQRRDSERMMICRLKRLILIYLSMRKLQERKERSSLKTLKKWQAEMTS
jgi:hypothetical protein